VTEQTRYRVDPGKKGLLSDSTRKMLIAFTIGAILAGAAVAFLMFRAADDEDRPPIIVRGGSLIFQSEESGTPGKKWAAKVPNKEWISDHDAGKWVSMFEVTFEGPNDCSSAYTPELTVYYKAAAEKEDIVSFQVLRQPKNQGNNKMETVISGAGLTEDNNAANPTLTYAGTANEILRVDYKRGPSTIASCEAPTKVTIKPIP